MAPIYPLIWGWMHGVKTSVRIPGFPYEDLDFCACSSSVRAIILDFRSPFLMMDPTSRISSKKIQRSITSSSLDRTTRQPTSRTLSTSPSLRLRPDFPSPLRPRGLPSPECAIFCIRHDLASKRMPLSGLTFCFGRRRSRGELVRQTD